MSNKQIILTPNQLKNVSVVQSYIQNSFVKRKTKKSNKLYINICNIYNYYPNLIVCILNDIPKLGYYKDYFHILSFSKSNDLNNYIYTIVINQLNEDINNMNANKKISTLGKWLPSEGSKINRKINFIDTFNRLFWINEQHLNKFTLRKKYRLLKTTINAKLGTLEAMMCAKNYDNINFNKTSKSALQKHTHHLIAHEGVQDKLDTFNINRLKKMDLYYFTVELCGNRFSVEQLESVFNNTNYHFNIPYIKDLMNNMICVIDLSKEMFTNNTHLYAIGMALLVERLSRHKNCVIIGNDIIHFNEGMNIVDRKNTLIKYSGPCRDIDVQRYKNLINSDERYTLLFVTNKKINVNVSEKVLQIVPYYSGNYDIIMYENDDYKKITKYDVNESVGEKMALIISESDELRDMSYLWYIVAFVIFFIGLKFMEFMNFFYV